jgi:murein DD-endopeptidase MepM/ murein hydrolase activator NlpD
MNISTSRFVNILVGICLLILALPVRPVEAQSTAAGPTYVVQPGDTLDQIAEKFGVSLEDLVSVNNIADANLIAVGTSLVIPGLEGINGVLTAKNVQLGETLDTLLKSYKISEDLFLRLNRVTSPSELYVGSSIIVPVANQDSQIGYFASLAFDETLLELCAQKNISPWQLILSNQADSEWDFLPSDHIFFETKSPSDVQSIVSPLITSIDLEPLPLIQGATVEIKIDTPHEMTLSGSLNGFPLQFFPNGQGQYVALQGIEAMATIGLAPLQINGRTPEGDTFSIDQMLLLESGNFPKDPPLYVENDTIDPAITGPEDQQIRTVISPATAARMWNSQWSPPLDDVSCIKSGYGNRRSFNGSEYIYFHSGIDYGVCAPSLNIYAVAPGIVVFVGDLTVRGNAVIIDHGWGVYSAYYHQAATAVNVGDSVQQGQIIGTVGATGRVTGAHLHFEVWVNGVQVQPLDWLANTYP